MYVCMYVCMYICMYVCMYVHIYILCGVTTESIMYMMRVQSCIYFSIINVFD